MGMVPNGGYPPHPYGRMRRDRMRSGDKMASMDDSRMFDRMPMGSPAMHPSNGMSATASRMSKPLHPGATAIPSKQAVARMHQPPTMDPLAMGFDMGMEGAMGLDEVRMDLMRQQYQMDMRQRRQIDMLRHQQQMANDFLNLDDGLGQPTAAALSSFLPADPSMPFPNSSAPSPAFTTSTACSPAFLLSPTFSQDAGLLSSPLSTLLDDVVEEYELVDEDGERYADEDTPSDETNLPLSNLSADPMEGMMMDGELDDLIVPASAPSSISTSPTLAVDDTPNLLALDPSALCMAPPAPDDAALEHDIDQALAAINVDTAFASPTLPIAESANTSFGPIVSPRISSRRTRTVSAPQLATVKRDPDAVDSASETSSSSDSDSESECDDAPKAARKSAAAHDNGSDFEADESDDEAPRRASSDLKPKRRRTQSGPAAAGAAASNRRMITPRGGSLEAAPGGSPSEPVWNNDGTLTCKCGRGPFMTLGGLRAHAKLHGIGRPFVCGTCEKTFQRKQ
ncbi:hypothetical protein HK101_004937, partial [Irineochytrium annulatum]